MKAFQDDDKSKRCYFHSKKREGGIVDEGADLEYTKSLLRWAHVCEMMLTESLNDPVKRSIKRPFIILL